MRRTILLSIVFTMTYAEAQARTHEPSPALLKAQAQLQSPMNKSGKYEMQVLRELAASISKTHGVRIQLNDLEPSHLDQSTGFSRTQNRSMVALGQLAHVEALLQSLSPKQEAALKDKAIQLFKSCPGDLQVTSEGLCVDNLGPMLYKRYLSLRVADEFGRESFAGRSSSSITDGFMNAISGIFVVATDQVALAYQGLKYVTVGQTPGEAYFMDQVSAKRMKRFLIQKMDGFEQAETVIQAAD